MNMIKKMIPVGSVAAVLYAASFAAAAPLVDFKPAPTSPTLSEFDLIPGVAGGLINGLGTLWTNSGGGLLVETPLLITQNIIGKTITSTNTTQFANASLYFTSTNGPADVITAPVIGTIAYQILLTGSFQIYSQTSNGSDPRNAANGAVLLLAGTLGQAAITGQLDGLTASVRDNFVTFNGGVIFDTLKASLGNPAATVLGGSLSISLNDLTNPFGPDSAFSSNATGLFSTPVIPEGGQASIIGGAMMALAFRRRSRAVAA